MKKGDKKWYKSWSNWLILIACIILIPIILMNLSIMMQAKKDSDKVPSVFGIKPFMVLSGSMETKIKIGDLILTREIDPSTLKVDDVIAFRDAENTVTTHRIIDIVVQDGQTYFITKGDNNNAQDRNLVEYADVEGIYIGRIPGVGSMMKSLAEPTTILVLVFGITVVFVIGFTISNRKQREMERKEYLEYKRLKEQEESSTKKVKKQEEPKEKIQEENSKKDVEVEKEQEEYLEYKKKKEEQEKQRQEDKEREEFLEFKRMKEQKEKELQEEKEREEFLEFKRQQEKQNSKNDED